MLFLFIHQILPLAAVWLAFAFLGRIPSFRRWGVPAVLLAGAAVQFALWLDGRPNLDGPDSQGYIRLALGQETDLRAILFRPKLYPLFLGIFPSWEAATLAQCALKVGTGALIARFGAICGWAPVTSAFLVFLYSFNSLWLQEPLRILDTTLFTFLFAASVTAAAAVAARPGPRSFAFFCLSAGLATLTRQAGDASLLLIAAAAAAMWMRAGRGAGSGARAEPSLPGRGRPAVAVAVGLFLFAGMLIGYSGAIENGLRHGVFRRSVSLGMNLYTHTSFFRLADGASPEWEFVEARLPGARGRHRPWNTAFVHDIPWSVNDLPHSLERAMGTDDAESILANDASMRDRSLRWMAEEPGRYLASIANELARLLGKSEELAPQSLLREAFPVPDPVWRLERGVIHQPPWLLLALGIAGLAFGKGPRRPAAMVALAAGGYIAVVAAVQMGFTRYALPSLPLLFMLLGRGCDRLAGLLPDGEGGGSPAGWGPFRSGKTAGSPRPGPDPFPKPRPYRLPPPGGGTESPPPPP